MVRLNPEVAAKLADDVYLLTRLPTLKSAFGELNDKYPGVFEFSEENLIKGKTGGPGLIKCKTAFGFTLTGKGPLKGNAFILVRGTQYLADWLTNLNVISTRSCGYNQPIHDGFNAAFKSMLPQIQAFAQYLQNQNIHTIHCIGHSLGGALALLCGEWVKANLGIKPFVYTFGSPRVGFESFASSCVREMGANHIFRAYHKTDVVPCIPIWPYVHTPNNGIEFYLPSPGVLPGAEYHGMAHYIESVKNKTWDMLAGQKKEQKSEVSIMAWLKDQTPAGVTIKAIEWIDAALQFVICKIVGATAWLFSATLGSAATIMDRLAYILANGMAMEEKISSWIMLLINKIQQFLGLVFEIKKEHLSQDFIRLALSRLQTKLNVMANSALSNALVKGRAIE